MSFVNYVVYSKYFSLKYILVELGWQLRIEYFEYIFHM